MEYAFDICRSGLYYLQLLIIESYIRRFNRKTFMDIINRNKGLSCISCTFTSHGNIGCQNTFAGKIM